MTTTGIAILAFIILACIAFIFYTEWKARKEHEADMRKQDERRAERQEADRQERQARRAAMVASSPPIRTGASIQRNQGAPSKRVEPVSVVDSHWSKDMAWLIADDEFNSFGGYSSGPKSSSSSDSSSSSGSCGSGD